MSTKEEWRAIKGYEGRYEVSNLGRVRSCTRIEHHSRNYIRNRVGKILTPATTNRRYLNIILQKNGKRKTHYIHRLVAEAFIMNPYNYPQINHIDGNKRNNCVENLEWCTPKENHIHALELGLIKRKTLLTKEQIQEIRTTYIPRDKVCGGRVLAKKYGVSKSTICNLVNNKTID